MSFPSHKKISMRDCILKIFWPEDHIVQFFKNNGCTKADIKILEGHKDLHRYQIVDLMFDHLSGKPDCGLGQFREMLQAITTWSHFDQYYFEQLRKLKRSDAETAISH